MRVAFRLYTYYEMHILLCPLHPPNYFVATLVVVEKNRTKVAPHSPAEARATASTYLVASSWILIDWEIDRREMAEFLFAITCSLFANPTKSPPGSSLGSDHSQCVDRIVFRLAYTGVSLSTIESRTRYSLSRSKEKGKLSRSLGIPTE